MSNWKKTCAVLLTAILILAMSLGALAATLTNGEIGGFANPDTPTSQEKNIDIKKELTVYNLDETSIHAPTISYTYTITAGAADVSITDATTDHTSEQAITAYTKAGITTGLKVNNASGTTGTIAWAATETVTASTDGTANYKNLNIDFSEVVFGAPGIYRYVITETAPDYAASGVTETTSSTNPHVRYLDVYVRAVPTGYTDGTKAADWDIYGYVCTLENEDITDAGDSATTGAVKTNGFVAGKNDGTEYKADSYYTFNIVISKTVVNDAYAKANHAFPFTVLFTNSTITQAVDINIEPKTTGTVTGYTDPASGALSAGNTNGIALIKDSSSVKYIGIPNGTTVEVYETNDVTGVTYQVSTVTDGGDPVVDAIVISGSAPTSAAAQASTKADYESTKTTITTTANADDDVAHSVAITNTLLNISPTGVILRVAPYVLMLAAGVILFVIARRKRATR